jgi:hypothetical protein
MRSNSGQLWRNSRYSLSVQKPQVRHIALKVPLRVLALGRRAESNHAADTRIQGFSDSLDRATLPGGIAAFHPHLLRTRRYIIFIGQEGSFL